MCQNLKLFNKCEFFYKVRSTCGTSPVIPVANAGRVLLKRQLFQQRDLIKIQVVGGENATPDRWPWMVNST